jgi:ABC-type multidrug transport system ATPase subunit
MADPVQLFASGLAIRRGGRDVLVDVELALGPGVFELLGPNGSGKSTLLRALAGVGGFHRGRIQIGGRDLARDPIAAKRRLGFMPETAELWPSLTPRELLATFAAIRGVADDGAADFAALTRPAALDLRIGTLSAGQRRKLALVAAIQGAPLVWLLDEPSDALDAEALVFLRDSIGRHRRRGGTVLISTHRPNELDVGDGPADGVLHLAAGRLTGPAG